MKCPKCGYISFDYNEVCPKCNRDISGAGAKMNHPSYIPNPPSLLGSLIGQDNGAPLDLEFSPPEGIPPLKRPQEMDSGKISPDPAVEAEPEEFEISIDSDMEDEIMLEELTVEEPYEASDSEEEILFEPDLEDEIDFEDLTIDEPEQSLPEEEIPFEPDLADLDKELESPDSLMDRKDVSMEDAGNIEEGLDLALDLDDEKDSDMEEKLNLDPGEESKQEEEEDFIFDLEEPSPFEEDEIEHGLGDEVSSKLAEAASLLDEISADDNREAAKAEPSEDMDEKLTLDLDSLEFELDLDEPKEK